MNDHAIVVLGAGIAAFGAAAQLKREGVRPIVYEKRSTYGGHTTSHRGADGFIFDEGPHVSFTTDQRMQQILADAVGGEFERIQTYVNNYWQGYWIKHPAMVNLHGLPEDLVANCIADFVATTTAAPQPIRHYADWLLQLYGPTYAETFPYQYTRKYHTTEPTNMTTDWIGKRLYRADLKEVIRGALTAQTPNVHYIDRFRYPSYGGFMSYLNPFAGLADFYYNHEVARIDPVARTVAFTNGKIVRYAALISSLPLPELLPMIEAAPAEVLDAATRLACTQAVIVNIGLKREEVSNAHWTYFYDEDIVFTRLSFPHKLSPHTVPPGCCAIQAEVYFSAKYRPLPAEPASYIEPVIHDLMRVGLIVDPDEIIHRSVIFAPYANVIFDQQRSPALATIRGYLDDAGILSCGRYGHWGYLWTDQSFMSGEKAARQALDRISGQRHEVSRI